MTALRVQVVVNPSEDPENHVVNTWWCAPRNATSEEDAADEFVDWLDTFYQAIDGSMAISMSGQEPSVKVYDMADPKPRQPILERTLTALTSTQSDNLPRELAIVLSFRGAYISGQNPARRRGRVYLGPWAKAVIDGNTGGITSAWLTTLDGACTALFASHSASLLASWIVYSPTTDTGGVGGLGVADVAAGWIDSEWDIQRRRGGNHAISRITF